LTVDKFTALTPELFRYSVENSSHRDELSREVEEAAASLGDSRAQMQIAGNQAAFISVLVAAIGARRALEVGTFLGYGALAIARALPEDGQLVCCELEQDYAARARDHLERAGVADRVEIRVGPASETLAAIEEDDSFDFAFIDADKSSYPDYFEQCLRLLRHGGLIMLDNVYMGGRITDEDPDEATQVVDRLNRDLASDPRVEVAVLSVADGVTLVRKL
jgi:predicted O-methyltransferase YrrM